LYLHGEVSRDRVIQQVAAVAKAFPLDFNEERVNPTIKNDFLMALGEYDMAVCTRAIVHFSLYIDTITQYGTEKHRVHIDRAYKMQEIGCFGMTELGHGSNVSSVETLATYNKSTHTFTINSPTRTSSKWWIGAAGKTASMSVVFAQLLVEGVNCGVHAFLIPIRNTDHSAIPEVIIGDCGPKLSLNGVDNGFIIFKNYSVPYDALLDKLSQVTRDGKFKSSIKNKEKRLGIMLGGLTRGRSCVVLGSSLGFTEAVGIAIRFAALRKQFNVGNGPEVSILSYQQHAYRLIPLLAQVFAVRAGYLWIQRVYELKYDLFQNEPEGEDLAEFHCVLSGLKVMASWYAVSGIQVCRECCGGLGYSSFSGLGRLRNNQEVHSTWEGDNSVLIQQTGKYIMKQIQKHMKGQKIFSPYLHFLKLNSEHPGQKFVLSDHLRFEELTEALEHLINHLLNNSVNKLQENAGKTETVTEAWNNTQTFHLTDLSKVFTEYIMALEVKQMAKNIGALCEKTGKVVENLASLYVLTVIEKNLAGILELGYDLSTVSKVRDHLLTLCKSISEVSVNIVDSLLPGDRTLGSVIGSSDGQAYHRMISAVESSPQVYDAPYWLPELRKIQGK
jgi:acyl-CoA oxidase